MAGRAFTQVGIDNTSERRMPLNLQHDCAINELQDDLLLAD
jgi:hypothetical protein